MSYALVIATLISSFAYGQKHLEMGQDSTGYGVANTDVIQAKETTNDNRAPSHRNMPLLPDINIKSKFMSDHLKKMKATFKDVIYKTNLDSAENYITGAVSKKKSAKRNDSPDLKVDSVSTVSSGISKIKSRRDTEKSIVKKKYSRKKKKRRDIFVFNKNVITKKNNDDNVTIPKGSRAVAEMMGGIEADNKQDLDIRLLGAFVGPNNSFVELSDCHVWVEYTPLFNKKRLDGKSKSFTCRNKATGEIFDGTINGVLQDYEDEYRGISAYLNTNNMERAAAISFLDGAVKGFGEAIAAAKVTQTFSDTEAGSNPKMISNVTGTSGEYIAGKTVAGATGKFLGKVSDFYWEQKPYLSVPSGTKVIIVIKKTTSIPERFFRKKKIINNEKRKWERAIYE